MATAFKNIENKWKYLKISVVAWCFVILISVCIVQYLRNRSDENTELETDPEVDELVMQSLNIQRGNQREKRTVDVAAYRELGWRFTPQEAKIVFDAYYKCIEERNKAYNETMHIKATLGLEGQTVKLTCHACFRPDQDPSSYEIEWQQLRTQDGVLRYVEPNDRIRITKQKMLVILQVDIIDSGQYFCVQSRIQEYIEIYQLDVIFKERVHIVPENGQKDLLPTFNLNDNNLKVFTLWSEWSDCNHCNRIGKRRKVGICMVSKINKTAPIDPVDIPIIVLYPDGIPCRSTVLPKQIASIKRIHFRRSETIMGDCFLRCPTTPAFMTITNSNGKIIETIDAGFYSMRNKPTLPPMVKRKVIYTTTRQKIVLTCPNSEKKEKLIRWENGSFPLNPLTIRRQTRGRVRIDSVNRLHIRGLRKSDTSIYSCWVQSRLVCTTKVVITEGINPAIHKYILTTGIVTTLVSISLICVCTLGNKARKAKSQNKK